MCNSDGVMLESVKMCVSEHVKKNVVQFGALVMAQSESPVVLSGTEDTLEVMDTGIHGMVIPRAAVADEGTMAPVGLADDQDELNRVEVTPRRVAHLSNVVRQPVLCFDVPHSVIIIGV